MSTMYNIRGDVYDVEREDTLLGNKIVEIPIAYGVTGHWTKLGMGKEGDVSGVHERDRSPGHRVSLSVPYFAIEAIVDGVYFKITHRRHIVTKAWVCLDTPEVYKIDTVFNAFSSSAEMVVSLTKFDG